MLDNKKEYGDYQTPLDFASTVVKYIKNNYDFTPDFIIEPSCGIGNFFEASKKYYKSEMFGIEINKNYSDTAKKNNPKAIIYNESIFSYKWDKDMEKFGKTLILGNPPWITNTELGKLGSENLPQKKNFKKHKGLEALSGMSNFDISEFIILNLLKIGQEDIPKADIYHCVTTGYAGFIGCLVAHRKMGKFLLTEHGIYPREREEEILGANWIDADFKNIWIDYFYYLSKLAYQYSDKIISLFEYTRGIQIYYGADEKKTKVIPNGVDEKKYGDIIKKKREGFHIGSVLRVVPIKDIKMMIKGFKIAEKNMPDATLWLIGPTDEDKEYYEECLELVKNLKLEEKVIFTGRANVLEYYSFLDLLILTSISEGQPLSILEGLASGIPFIATDVGNCREILLEKKDIGEAGLIIPPTSYTDLAEAFLKLYLVVKKIGTELIPFIVSPG